MQDIAGRDYYNDLSQAQLVDLVVSLQEQNLILTRLLERASTPVTAPVSVSPARLNLNPNLNFTRTKSGSSASRYASDKDFPSLKNPGTKTGSNSTTANNTTNKTKSATKNSVKKNSSRNLSKSPANTEEAKKWALRLFTPEPNSSDQSQPSSAAVPSGYTCVYLPINRKTKHADLREKLRILKINLNRIYAIQRPAKKVVSLLVHSAYAPEIIQICETEGIQPITDFDPIAGTNLGDPKLLESLNAAQLNDKARALYYNRMLQAAVQIREPRLGLTILKYFNSKDSSDSHAIPNVIVDQFIKLKPTAVRKISGANTANSILKGFDASKLFVSLSTIDANTTTATITTDSTSTSTANISNAGISPMDHS